MSAIRCLRTLTICIILLFAVLHNAAADSKTEGNAAPNFQENYLPATRSTNKIVETSLDPELRNLLRHILNQYDKNRFIKFYTGARKQFSVAPAKMEQIITNSMRYLGRKYVFGQLDCSSFTQRSFKAAGITIPRTAEYQAQLGKVITDRKQLQRGDLLFFTRTYRTGWFVTHVGIYLGSNLMIHASSDIVRITEFPEPGYWWKNHFVFGTRFVAAQTASAGTGQTVSSTGSAGDGNSNPGGSSPDTVPAGENTGSGSSTSAAGPDPVEPD